MPPSSSSFLELKAHLAKQEAEHQRKKVSGEETYIKGGIQKPEKKPTKWMKQNKDVAARNSRDLEWSLTNKPIWEVAKESLQRKASQYDKLKRGKTAGLKESQYESLLVDFDKKVEEDYDSSTSENNSYANDEDPIVEYVDEFGRSRKVPRSEVPRDFIPTNVESEEEEDPYLIYNDPNYFPTFEPSADKVLEVEKTLREDSSPALHYDATKEVRARGAAFYQFSKDEEARKVQMQELRDARRETENVRGVSGAGVTNEHKSKPGMEKRKRDIEERRKVIEAKKRRLKTDTDLSLLAGASSSKKEDMEATKLDEITEKDEPARITPLSADEFLAELEREMTHSK